MLFRSIVRALTLVTLGLCAAFAQAQDPSANYPNRPVRVISGSPGSTADITARFIGQKLSERLKQQFVIDNRAGAGSIIGLQYAQIQAPDGYNLMLTSTAYGFLIDRPKPPVDIVNSFAPVAFLGMGDSALTLHPSMRVNTVKELIDLAKKRPGELLYASSGIGGFPHMSTELFKMMTRTSITHVPFKGGGPAAVDTMSGHTQIIMGSLPTVATMIASGRLKLIATGGAKRNPIYPNIPTVEIGRVHV